MTRCSGCWVLGFFIISAVSEHSVQRLNFTVEDNIVSALPTKENQHPISSLNVLPFLSNGNGESPRVEKKISSLKTSKSVFGGEGGCNVTM